MEDAISFCTDLNNKEIYKFALKLISLSVCKHGFNVILEVTSRKLVENILP